MKETETAEIRLVEDNPNDAELTLDGLREHRVSNSRVVGQIGSYWLSLNQPPC